MPLYRLGRCCRCGGDWHPALTKLDAVTVQKIYTGKVIEVGGQAVAPINSVLNSNLRLRFLQAYLNQDEVDILPHLSPELRS